MSLNPINEPDAADDPPPLVVETVFARFRRSLSSASKKYLTRAPLPTYSQPSTPTLTEEVSQNLTARAGGSASRSETKDKLTPFERFVKLVRKKTRDGADEFPPPHWEDEEKEYTVLPTEGNTSNRPASHTNVDTGAAPFSHPDADQPSHQDVADSTADSPPEPEAPVVETDEQEQEPLPEPTSLAWTIQGLLASLSATLATASVPIPTAGRSNDVPGPTAFITDSKLISLLSSPSIMNGSTSNGRQSVWSVLERLRSKSNAPAQVVDSASSIATSTTGTDSGQESGFVSEDDESGVMLYGPLVPTEDSEVELARSEIVSLVSDAQDDSTPTTGQDAADNVERPKGRSGIWPFTTSAGMQQEKKADKSDTEQQARASKTTERRVWVPSKTKISLQVMWWGYRVYLPPPVLAQLDNKRLEAGKRAAMLSTALKWILDHIPEAAVPIQLRAALTILKALLPFVGYISAFIAWSWTTIKMFDKGNGVVLTATWLLPVAVIPGTWEDEDVPQS